jgi:uncharacterized membrane protein
VTWLLSARCNVLAVVIWIGGVSMVTTVWLPAIRRGELGPDQVRMFRMLRRPCVWQARSAALVAGVTVTGFYMVARFDLCNDFRSHHFWRLHVMVALWAIFVLVLSGLEPLWAGHGLPGTGSHASGPDMARVPRVIAFITILGAFAGSHRLHS